MRGLHLQNSALIAAAALLVMAGAVVNLYRVVAELQDQLSQVREDLIMPGGLLGTTGEKGDLVVRYGATIAEAKVAGIVAGCSIPGSGTRRLVFSASSGGKQSVTYLEKEGLWRVTWPFEEREAGGRVVGSHSVSWLVDARSGEVTPATRYEVRVAEGCKVDPDR